MKIVLRGKFIDVNAYIKKEDLKSITYFTTLGTSKRRTKFKAGWWKETIKIRAVINKTENRINSIKSNVGSLKILTKSRNYYSLTKEKKNRLKILKS